MTPFTLTIPGMPKAAPRPRSGMNKAKTKSITYNDPEYSLWKNQIAMVIVSQLRKHEWKWIVNGARVSIEFIFPRTETRPAKVSKSEWATGGRVRRLCTPDADNSWKGYVDAMTIGIKQTLRFTEWDDCMAEIGPTNRWYAAVGELPHAVMHVEPLDNMHSLFSDIQRANAHNYPNEVRRALVALERHIPAGDMRWHSLLDVAAKVGANIPLTA